jgi:recombination protein RecT
MNDTARPPAGPPAATDRALTVADKARALTGLLGKSLRSVESVLPKHMDAARFCRMAINAVLRNPALADCEPATFIMACINCAEMGLEPGLGEAALVPYKGRVQAQPMFQGLLRLARNAGGIKRIEAQVVLAGERFEWSLGLTPTLVHVPDPEANRDDEKALRFAYAYAVLEDGSVQFAVMNRAQITARRGVSKAAEAPDGPWKKWPGEMWRKTALKALCKTLPRSTTLARATRLDDEAETGIPQAPQMVDFAGLEIDVAASAAAAASQAAPERPLIPEPQRKSLAQPETPPEAAPSEPPAQPPAPQPPPARTGPGGYPDRAALLSALNAREASRTDVEVHAGRKAAKVKPSARLEDLTDEDAVRLLEYYDVSAQG